MILYFTGTGNAKYIAEKIAKVTGDETKNIVTYTRDNEKFLQGDGDRLVLVSPVYYWGIPESVKGFLKTLKTAGRYFAIVLECGGSTGNAQGVCERYVSPDAVFGVVAVDNFCPMFKIESAEETEKRLDALDAKIAVIADKIRNEEKGDFNDVKGGFYKLNTALLYPIYEKFGGRKTKFSASDDCVNCGLCESICPVSAIKIENGKPVWTKEKCDMCLSCLSRCPQNAISIKKSLKNGRYVNPRVKF